MNELNTKRILDDAIRSYIVESSIPLKEAAQRANMPASQFLNWWASKELTLEEDHSESFLGSISESLPNFIHRGFSLAVVGSNAMSPSILPERYGQNALSFVSSSRHILSIIELQYGKLVVHDLLKRLKVPFQYFENLQNRISIQFFEDLLQEYIKFGNSPDEFGPLSKALFITIEETTMQSVFPVASTYEEAFNTIKASTKYFDENFKNWPL